LSAKADKKIADDELEILLEAARRANWDALHGPVHLRTGRFQPNGEDEEAPRGADTVEDGTA
jgi:hypothetical protein